MTEQGLAIRTEMDLKDLGTVLSKSGYFTDTRDAAQAIVKVLAGREIGIGAVASMTGIYIVNGKPSLGANLIAAVVKRSGRYTYRVRRLDNTVCEIEFFEKLADKFESCGASVFTIEDARKAGTKNIDKYPRNMLFARAMSNGAKWYCADVFAGGVYTPDELGADVEYTDDGDIKVIDVVSTIPQNNGHKEPVKVTDTNGNKERPYSPEVLKNTISVKAKKLGDYRASEKQIGLLASMLEVCFAGEYRASDIRHAVTDYLTGYKSIKDMPGQYVKILLDWLDAKQDSGGAYNPCSNAIKEAQAVRTQTLLDAGQMQIFETAQELGAKVTQG